MAQARYQITLRSILVTVFWLGVWMMTLRWLEPDSLIDTGPDSLTPRLVFSFWIVPIGGIASALAGNPTGSPLKLAVVAWLIIALLIGILTPAIY